MASWINSVHSSHPPTNVHIHFLPLCPHFVTECKFVYWTHSEAEQTETSEFGAEKGLLQGQARKMGELCSKTWTPQWFSGEVFIGKSWGEGCRVCDFLLIGWWWGKWGVPGLWIISLLISTSLGFQHVVTIFWNRRGAGRAQLLKEWHSHRTWQKLVRTN